MLVVRSPRTAATRGLGAALALTLVLSSTAGAAELRLARPVTDASPATPTAPARVAPRSSRAIAITPVENSMRETAPGVYEGIVPFRLADGSWQVDLDERFMLFSVLRRTPGGSLLPACVQGTAGLSAWRASGAACDHAAAPARPASSPEAGVRRPLVVSPAGSTLTTWEVK